MIMKATSKTNTASRGMIARFKAFLTLGEFTAVEEMSSLEDSNRMSMTAMIAPPMPRPTAVVMVMALVASVVAAKPADNIRW